MLQAHALHCLKGDRLLFHGLDLAVRAGGILRVAGSNGTGKSSLLRILCGLALPDDGHVTWHDQPTSRCRDAFQRSLLYLGHAPALHELLSPLENLRAAVACAGDQADDDALAGALQRIGLEAQADLPLRALSQGQKRRAGLARLFLSAHRPLWILDEPFAALDPAAVEHVRDAVQAHCANGGMAVLTTHQEVPFDLPTDTITLGGLP